MIMVTLLNFSETSVLSTVPRGLIEPKSVEIMHIKDTQEVLNKDYFPPLSIPNMAHVAEFLLHKMN